MENGEYATCINDLGDGRPWKIGCIAVSYKAYLLFRFSLLILCLSIFCSSFQMLVKFIQFFFVCLYSCCHLLLLYHPVDKLLDLLNNLSLHSDIIYLLVYLFNSPFPCVLIIRPNLLYGIHRSVSRYRVSWPTSSDEVNVVNKSGWSVTFNLIIALILLVLSLLSDIAASKTRLTIGIRNKIYPTHPRPIIIMLQVLWERTITIFYLLLRHITALDFPQQPYRPSACNGCS